MTACAVHSDDNTAAAAAAAADDDDDVDDGDDDDGDNDGLCQHVTGWTWSVSQDGGSWSSQ